MVKLLCSRGFLTSTALFSTHPSFHLPRRYNSSNSFNSKMMESEHYKFGPYKIDPKEVFYSTGLSYAMVNLRPILPVLLSFAETAINSFIRMYQKRPFPKDSEIILHRSYVLVCPRREVKRFLELTGEETGDLWLTAKDVGGRLEHHYKASSLTFTIQDGPQAGQTVPHVHIHVIPRKGGDFEKNDEVYDAMDAKEVELKEKLDLDKDRKDRTLDEMAQEAIELRALFT